MGISGLLPLLKDVQEDIHISKYKGKVIGVDAYVWLHRGAYGCAQQLALGQATTSYVTFAMKKVTMLKHYGIIPYIVFDGGYLPAKAKTEEERERRRKENLCQAKTLLSQGRSQQAREYFVKCVDVTPAMAFQLIKALRTAGVDYIVAPYEADAQLAYLERRGTIEGIITEDSDLLVFGCKTVLYKLNDEGRCIELLHQNRSRCKSLHFSTFSDSHFRQMAILSGCDYLASIPGMGLKTAHRLLRQCGSVAKALSAARMEGLKVPETYKKDFERAEKTFVYQRVFHRSTSTGQTRMVTLTPCDGQTDIEDEDCIGPLLPPATVNSIAQGDLDPITKKLIVDLNPAFSQPPRQTPTRSSSSSYYAPPRPRCIGGQVARPGQKTLDTFFARDQTSQRGERKVLANVINLASPITDRRLPDINDDGQNDKQQGPEEKSRFFAKTTVTQSTPRKEDQSADVAELASFLLSPVQDRKRFSRQASTDSGEISSPASSAMKRTRDQLQSSPLIEDSVDRCSSPTTSPSLPRPRKSAREEVKPLFLQPQDTSDIEEEEGESEAANASTFGFFQQFAFQRTPAVTPASQQRSACIRSTTSSSSSIKRRATPLLFREEEDVFGESSEQTPLMKRSQSHSSSRILTSRTLQSTRLTSNAD